jgi:hypothetical protein
MSSLDRMLAARERRSRNPIFYVAGALVLVIVLGTGVALWHASHPLVPSLPGETSVPAVVAAPGKGKPQSRWEGKRLSPLPVGTLLSHGNTLWIGSTTAGLAVVSGEEVVEVYPGVIVNGLLPARGGQVLVGYTEVPGEPVTGAQDRGVTMTFSEPVFQRVGASGLARWDGKTWTPVVMTKHGVWDIALADDGLYLCTNDGVYLLEGQGRQAHRLGLAGTLCNSLLRDEDVLYVGTLGGIWRYAGGEWSHVLDLPDHKALAFARGGEAGMGTVGPFYAATTAGLYVSADGLAWRRQGSALSLEAVTIGPDGYVFTGGGDQVYALHGQDLAPFAHVPSLHALAWHQEALYAGGGRGLWRITPPGQAANHDPGR